MTVQCKQAPAPLHWLIHRVNYLWRKSLFSKHFISCYLFYLSCYLLWYKPACSEQAGALVVKSPTQSSTCSITKSASNPTLCWHNQILSNTLHMEMDNNGPTKTFQHTATYYFRRVQLFSLAEFFPFGLIHPSSLKPLNKKTAAVFTSITHLLTPSLRLFFLSVGADVLQCGYLFEAGKKGQKYLLQYVAVRK